MPTISKVDEVLEKLDRKKQNMMTKSFIEMEIWRCTASIEKNEADMAEMRQSLQAMEQRMQERVAATEEKMGTTVKESYNDRISRIEDMMEDVLLKHKVR